MIAGFKPFLKNFSIRSIASGVLPVPPSVIFPIIRTGTLSLIVFRNPFLYKYFFKLLKK
jgi:hypothetical protein